MSRNVYNSLRMLADNLNELFLELGHKTQMKQIQQPNGFVEFIRSITVGRALVCYIDDIARELKNAVNEAKSLRIDSWSANEYKNEIEKELAEKNKMLEKLEKEISDMKRNRTVTLPNPQNASQNNAESNTEFKWIMELVRLRDNQSIRKEFLIGQGEKQDSPGIRLIDSLLKETALLMENNGVEIINDTGEFTSERHIVMDTVKTDDPKLVNHIANMVRPGYIYKGSLIRPEEVIVYVL